MEIMKLNFSIKVFEIDNQCLSINIIKLDTNQFELTYSKHGCNDLKTIASNKSAVSIKEKLKLSNLFVNFILIL